MKLKVTVKAPNLNVDVPDAITNVSILNIDNNKIIADLEVYETEESSKPFGLERYEFKIEELSSQTKVALNNFKNALIRNEIKGIEKFQNATEVDDILEEPEEEPEVLEMPIE